MKKKKFWLCIYFKISYLLPSPACKRPWVVTERNKFHLKNIHFGPLVAVNVTFHLQSSQTLKSVISVLLRIVNYNCL